MDVIYTDRYGAAGAPPWLLGCHGECEALGWYPELEHGRDERCNEAHEGTSEPCDGWHMRRCPDCAGTGRATRLQVIARLPSYVLRGLRAMRWMLLSPAGWRQYRAPWTSRRQYVLVALRAAWS